MPKETLFNGLAVGVYLALMAWLVLRTLRQTRTEKRDIEFEAVGTRRYSALVIGIAIAETMLGPADAMALSQNGLKYGLAWAIFPMGAALAQFVAGTFFVRRIVENYTGRLTLGDIFEERCGRSSRLAVGGIVTLQAIAFSGVLILAGGQVLQSFLRIPLAAGMILTALVVATYTVVGGMRAVIETNSLQAVFAWSVAALAGVATVYLIAGSPSEAPLVTTDAFVTDHPLNIGIGIFVAYFMGELLLPAYSIRALVAKDARAARNGFLLTGAMLVVWYLVITMAGSAGRLLAPEQRISGDNLILLDVVRAYLAPTSWLWYLAGAIIVAGLLALIHSTFDAFLNAGAVSFSRDFTGSLLSVDAKRQGAVARIAVVAIAILGTTVAFSGDSLIGILLIGYTLWVPSLLAPFIWILLRGSERLAPVAFWVAVLGGGAAWYLFEYQFKTVIPGILAGFLANAVLLVVVQRFAGAVRDQPERR